MVAMMSPLLAALPELSCRGGVTEVGGTLGVTFGIVDVVRYGLQWSIVRMYFIIHLNYLLGCVRC